MDGKPGWGSLLQRPWSSPPEGWGCAPTVPTPGTARSSSDGTWNALPGETDQPHAQRCSQPGPRCWFRRALLGSPVPSHAPDSCLPFSHPERRVHAEPSFQFSGWLGKWQLPCLPGLRTTSPRSPLLSLPGEHQIIPAWPLNGPPCQSDTPCAPPSPLPS